jgi:hypothetical protein
MQRTHLRSRIFLPTVTTLMLALVGCGIGGFQLRSQPTATPAVQVTVQPTRTTSPTAAPLSTPAPTATATVAADPTADTAPAQSVSWGEGQNVRAATALNVRDNPGTTGRQVGRLGAGQVVTIRGGPAEADGYVWWRIDSGAGLTGWVAAGPTVNPWLVLEGERLVNRPLRVGDRVQVTTEQGKVLTVREAAGRDARSMAHVLSGSKLTVLSGPEQRDGLTWWEVEGDQVRGWAAEGDGQDRWITPLES